MSSIVYMSAAYEQTWEQSVLTTFCGPATGTLGTAACSPHLISDPFRLPILFGRMILVTRVRAPLPRAARCGGGVAGPDKIGRHGDCCSAVVWPLSPHHDTVTVLEVVRMPLTRSMC